MPEPVVGTAVASAIVSGEWVAVTVVTRMARVGFLEEVDV